MSHVSALPRAPSASVLEESAAEATQFALATLESFPSVFEKLDAGDAAVVTLGAVVVARAAFSAVAGGFALTGLTSWLPRLRWLRWLPWASGSRRL